MSLFVVTSKSDGGEVIRYVAIAATESVGYPFADFDHTETPEDAPVAAPQSRTLTKREFIKRFSVDEYAAIKAAAESNPAIDYYWQMFMLAEEIVTTDPDTVAGVQTLESIGLIAEGRAQEILNG